MIVWIINIKNNSFSYKLKIIITIKFKVKRLNLNFILEICIKSDLQSNSTLAKLNPIKIMKSDVLTLKNRQYYQN
jgi:hypothetical protein